MASLYSSPLNKSKHVASVGRTNSSIYAAKSSYKNASFKPTGPALADEIFQVGGGWEEASEYLDPEVGDTDDIDWEYQFELPLESTIELQERLRHNIRRYERGYNKMALAALRWHQMMVDIEDNANLQKLFNDLQLMRKLSGSDFE